MTTLTAIAPTFRPNGPEKRILYALQVNFRSEQTNYIIVWPDRPAEHPDRFRLLNSKRTWLTARAGDVVVSCKPNSTETERRFIKSIQIFGASPVIYNGVFIQTGQQWLDSVPALCKSTLSKFSDGIPCDRRGYIPTVQTSAFDLDWDHGSDHTHYFDGTVTPYGLNWQIERWPQIVMEACRLTAIAQAAPDDQNTSVRSKRETLQ